jgi:hypothetical protein
MADPSNRDRHPALRPLAVLAAAVALWAGLDLFGPDRCEIRVFDPDQVARLDTAMWRSYYDRRPAALFLQLAELMRRQFHFPYLRSYAAAFRAARAAFVFKAGHDRGDYRRALPDLMRYYGGIRTVSTSSFDVRTTAERELEWWIVHREGAGHAPHTLAQALARGAAALYGVPPEVVADYARARTTAMIMRDTTATTRALNARDWSAIEDTLRTAWRSLAQVVRPAGAAAVR